MGKLNFFRDWISTGKDNFIKKDSIVGVAIQQDRTRLEKYDIDYVSEPFVHIYTTAGTTVSITYDDIKDANEDFTKLKEYLEVENARIPDTSKVRLEYDDQIVFK